MRKWMDYKNIISAKNRVLLIVLLWYDERTAWSRMQKTKLS